MNNSLVASKKFFVYPHGISGSLLGAMIEFVEVDNLCGGGGKMECIIDFIDDSSPLTSLETKKDSLIFTNSVVLLANNKVIGANEKTITILKEKLESLNIKYNENAFVEYALKVAKKLKEQVWILKWQNIIGIELCGIANDKHIGYLDDYLLGNSSANILYICATRASYDKITQKIQSSVFKDRMLAICYPLEHTEELDFLRALCKTSLTNTKNNNVPTIYLGHALTNWSSIDVERYYGDKVDYLSVGLSGFKAKNLENLKMIECGYLGFDLIAKKIKKTKKDSILFAPYNKDEFLKFLPLIKVALSKYRVIYRDRRFFEGSYKWGEANETIESLRTNDNFIISDSWEISEDVYSRSFAFVGGITTTINTFPLISLSPSISDSPRLDSNLGIKCELVENSFLEILDRVYCSLETWEQKILEFRNKNVYNFGFASEVLGEFVIKNFINKEIYE